MDDQGGGTQHNHVGGDAVAASSSALLLRNGSGRFSWCACAMVKLMGL
uniref:Predicted protein n=1 Tax=Hordeum vulgare subsp. vulgare TaxID=112509 RepID=F2DBD7_HORVV|nr:predicted protein [Hordeum vulgare subsp. vulgare]